MIRGIHLDFRAQKLKADAVCDILGDISALGYNAVLIEYMDAFPFDGELSQLAAPDALTKDEIKRILNTAAEYNIEVIPLLQCFGHMYWVLRHPEFEHLAEGWHENMTDRERKNDCGWSILPTMCPSNPEAVSFYREMARQVLALHMNCKYFHIGGDEIGMLRCSECKSRIEKDGLANVLSQHYIGCADFLCERGIKPIMWADIALAYPKTLDALREKVILMDWDYWSDGTPTGNGKLWGQENVLHEPDKWTPITQELFRPYFFYKEPELVNAFPYIDALKADGFGVMLACAARSGGDSFCVPSDRHVYNTRAAVKKAEKSEIEGFVITSWSVRRSPWYLTEYTLLVGAYPDLSDDELAEKYSEICFGVCDKQLGRLPLKIGRASAEAAKACSIIESYNDYCDYETGNFLGIPYDKDNMNHRARTAVALENADKVREKYGILRETLFNSQSLLKGAKPQTEKQKYKVALWDWAIRTLLYFCKVAELIVNENSNKETVDDMKKEALALEKETRTLLGKIYTDFSVDGGIDTRFGVCLKYLEKLEKKIKAASSIYHSQDF